MVFGQTSVYLGKLTRRWRRSGRQLGRGGQPAKELVIGHVDAISKRLVTEDDLEWNHLDAVTRSEEHTSELQSQSNLVCRLLLEKKKKYDIASSYIYTSMT